MSTEDQRPADTPETPLSDTSASSSDAVAVPPAGEPAVPTPDDKLSVSPAAAAPTADDPAPLMAPEVAAAAAQGELPSRYRPAADKVSSSRTPGARPGKSPKPARPKRVSPAGLTEPGPASRLFRRLSLAGLPVLMLLTALMTLSQLLVVRPLWFSDEVRHADVYMRLLEGHWLALNLNGLPYPDKPPLYFWFLNLLDRIPGVDQPLLFFLGAALSAVLFTGATWLLARATGHDRRVSFAAGLISLGCLFVAGTAHYPRMDLLFATVITLSLLCLYRGWIKKSGPVWLTFGFVLAGIATLIKGPLGLAFPLLSSVLFLFWRGTPGRLNGRDGLFGFLLMLIMLSAWMGALLFQGESDYLRDIFGPQIAGRIVNAWHHAAPWWYYLAALPLIWLPWTLLIPFIDWWKACRRLPAAWKARREDGGRGWLWLTVLGGTALLSVVSGKIAIYLLPLLPALAVLTARALLLLSPRRSRWFFFCLGLFFGLLGLLFVAAQFGPRLLPLLPESWTTTLPAVARAYLDNTSGLAFMGLALLLLAVVLLFFTRRSLPDGSLLSTGLGIVLLMQPYALAVAPSLDTMLSPRAQAEVMAEYVRRGYAPAAYRVYPGVYAYYLDETLAAAAPDAPRPDTVVPDLNDGAALTAFLAEHPRAVVAMREKDWRRWTDKPSDIFEIHRQWIVDQPYVLAAREGMTPPTTPAPENVPADTAPIPLPEDASGRNAVDVPEFPAASETPPLPELPASPAEPPSNDDSPVENAPAETAAEPAPEYPLVPEADAPSEAPPNGIESPASPIVPQAATPDGATDL